MASFLGCYDRFWGLNSDFRRKWSWKIHTFRCDPICCDLLYKSFNKAAHENGKRKLTGYIRCKTGRENHPYERTGEISAHVALEFYEESKEKYFVIGAVIDSATEGQETVVRYLMDNVMLEDEMFKIGNRPRTITEFRSFNNKNIKLFAKTNAEGKNDQTAFWKNRG